MSLSNNAARKRRECVLLTQVDRQLPPVREWSKQLRLQAAKPRRIRRNRGETEPLMAGREETSAELTAND